jgi:hypothetical protein
MQQRGQWQWWQERWQQGWRASNGNESNGDGEGKQKLTSDGINKGGWWLAREHQRGDHMTTMVGNDKQQKHASDDDGSNKEGDSGKGNGDGNGGGGQQRGQGHQGEGWHWQQGWRAT